MKRDKTQIYSKMTKTRVSSLNKKMRDLTPDLQIRNKINFISSENNLLSVSNNQSLSFFRPEQKRIKNRIMSSYSPNERTSKNSINPIILSIIKGRSISKRIINNYRKNISSLKKNYGFTSSRSKNKRKQKKQIPFHKKKLQQLSVNTFQSNETINSNNTISNTNNNLFVHSSKLSENEIKSLMMINNMITNLLSKTNNKALVFSELDNIYKNAFANLNVNYHEYAKGNNTSDNIIHSSSTNNNTTDDSNNNIFNKLDVINTKCEMIQEENNKLKKLIPKSSETFEDVKESIKNFKAEINKIKKNSTIATTKKVTKQSCPINENKTLTNKNKYPIKNISLNLQLVQKVKDIKNICSDSQRNNKSKENNDTIIETQMKNEEMNDLNFENIANNKVHDFNDEFLENYENFSPSWRKEVDRMNQRKKDYQMM